MAILAPTKVTAARVAGQTYHSFFGFRPRYVGMHDIANPRVHPTNKADDEPVDEEEVPTRTPAAHSRPRTLHLLLRRKLNPGKSSSPLKQTSGRASAWMPSRR